MSTVPQVPQVPRHPPPRPPPAPAENEPTEPLTGQPETRPISQQQLVAEVTGTHAVLARVESNHPIPRQTKKMATIFTLVAASFGMSLIALHLGDPDDARAAQYTKMALRVGSLVSLADGFGGYALWLCKASAISYIILSDSFSAATSCSGCSSGQAWRRPGTRTPSCGSP